MPCVDVIKKFLAYSESCLTSKSFIEADAHSSFKTLSEIKTSIESSSVIVNFSSSKEEEEFELLSEKLILCLSKLWELPENAVNLTPLPLVDMDWAKEIPPLGGSSSFELSNWLRRTLTPVIIPIHSLPENSPLRSDHAYKRASLSEFGSSPRSAEASSKTSFLKPSGYLLVWMRFCKAILSLFLEMISHFSAKCDNTVLLRVCRTNTEFICKLLYFQSFSPLATASSAEIVSKILAKLGGDHFSPPTSLLKLKLHDLLMYLSKSVSHSLGHLSPVELHICRAVLPTILGPLDPSDISLADLKIAAFLSLHSLSNAHNQCDIHLSAVSVALVLRALIFYVKEREALPIFERIGTGLVRTTGMAQNSSTCYLLFVLIAFCGLSPFVSGSVRLESPIRMLQSLGASEIDEVVSLFTREEFEFELPGNGSFSAFSSFPERVFAYLLHRITSDRQRLPIIFGGLWSTIELLVEIDPSRSKIENTFSQILPPPTRGQLMISTYTSNLIFSVRLLLDDIVQFGDKQVVRSLLKFAERLMFLCRFILEDVRDFSDVITDEDDLYMENDIRKELRDDLQAVIESIKAYQ